MYSCIHYMCMYLSLSTMNETSHESGRRRATASQLGSRPGQPTARSIRKLRIRKLRIRKLKIHKLDFWEAPCGPGNSTPSKLRVRKSPSLDFWEVPYGPGSSTPYTRSPLENSRLFGPSPWKILATTYDKQIFLSNPAPGENLLSGSLVMETGCIR